MEPDEPAPPHDLPRLVYVVNALQWQWTDEWYAIQDDTPVRAFLSREDAERHRDCLEQDKAREISQMPPESRWRTPLTESGVPEPFYEVVAVEYLP